uniref:Putative secreted protein synganglion overexpressed n=1 Tax=Rhipicephalus microplus TaxID=6941 RepID=A0A6M2DB02_RHIMP
MSDFFVFFLFIRFTEVISRTLDMREVHLFRARTGVQLPVYCLSLDWSLVCVNSYERFSEFCSAIRHSNHYLAKTILYDYCTDFSSVNPGGLRLLEGYLKMY